MKQQWVIEDGDLLRAGPVSPYLPDPLPSRVSATIGPAVSSSGEGDMNTASDAIHEAATRAIKGSIPVVIGMDGDSRT